MNEIKNILSRQFFVVNTTAWLLIFALTVSESLFYYQVNQRPIPYRSIIVNDFFILIWMPISVGMYPLISRWYANRSTWVGLISRLVILGFFSILAVMLIESFIHYLDGLEDVEVNTFSAVFLQLIFFRFHTNLILYLGFSAISMAAMTFIETKRSQKKQAELGKHLMEAQLGVLKAQMKPHFLFNSLHAISGLILKNQNELAITVIAKLSDLLRDSLNMDDKKLIPLKEELAFVERYLEIYVLRFGDQLTYTIDTQSGLESSMVPPALIQPLIENALIHGVIPNGNHGHVDVRISQEETQLKIEVIDHTPSAHAADHEVKEGLGLSNTRKRLASLYADAYALNFCLRPDAQGASTKILLPLVSE